MEEHDWLVTWIDYVSNYATMSGQVDIAAQLEVVAGTYADEAATNSKQKTEILNYIQSRLRSLKSDTRLHST